MNATDELGREYDERPWGNYTVLDKIGAGGMGQVFKAEHRRMERIVACSSCTSRASSSSAGLVTTVTVRH